eukprot:162387_1
MAKKKNKSKPCMDHWTRAIDAFMRKNNPTQKEVMESIHSSPINVSQECVQYILSMSPKNALKAMLTKNIISWNEAKSIMSLMKRHRKDKRNQCIGELDIGMSDDEGMVETTRHARPVLKRSENVWNEQKQNNDNMARSMRSRIPQIPQSSSNMARLSPERSIVRNDQPHRPRNHKHSQNEHRHRDRERERGQRQRGGSKVDERPRYKQGGPRHDDGHKYRGRHRGSERDRGRERDGRQRQRCGSSNDERPRYKQGGLRDRQRVDGHGSRDDEQRRSKKRRNGVANLNQSH